MAAGDLIVTDDQYELNSYLIGTAEVIIGADGVTGWENASSDGKDAPRVLSDGAIAGFDVMGALNIFIPAVILRETEGEARDELAALKDAWRPAGYTDAELHRRVAGVHEYVVGRARGCTPEMGLVKSGTIPVLCHFFAGDPTIYEVGS